ncbi:MAG: MTAP family purine nucleoside phosphorylase [Anaerolineales bacterium]
MLCIFGGTAAYYLDLSDFAAVGETVEVDTPFGKSVPFTALTFPPLAGRAAPLPLPNLGEEGGSGGKVRAWFASRHGRESLSRSARFVNHRANVWAARELGCADILSWNGVGAMHPDLRVNDMVVPADLLDMTRARIADFGLQISDLCSSWHDYLVRKPFSQTHRRALIHVIETNDYQSPISNLQSQITYVCTEGPRLETPAEIRAYRTLGADVVGMTLSPEVWLAAEMGLQYASLCYVTNVAAGLGVAGRNFGRGVGERCLEVVLGAAALLAAGN